MSTHTFFTPTGERIRSVSAPQDTLGETPLWCERSASLLWLDIDGRKLQRLHPATGQVDTYTFDCQYAGSLALTTDPDTVLIGLDLGLYLFLLPDRQLHPLCQVEPATLDNRLNDGRCDAAGRFWVGTMDNQLSRPNGAFYRVDPSGDVLQIEKDVIVSNSIGFSPGNDRVYFSDTRRYTTWQYDLDVASGTVGPKQVFVDHTPTRSRPDGICVDAQGHVWTAIFAEGKIVRYSPQGVAVRVIEVPATNPTCLCLGGPELKTLYVTTARKFLDAQTLDRQPLSGSVLAIEVEVPGRPEHRFSI
jgi:sugar lactone lactonase YvrE